jgi:hypothetical protein
MRIESGRPVAHVAAEMGIFRPTAYKWWRRWQHEGEAGLVDRSSRAHSCPHRSSAELESAVEDLRRTLELGPVRIADRLGVPSSTVHRVLCRLGLNRLAWMDRPTGRVIRRYERDAPGERVGPRAALARQPDPHRRTGRLAPPLQPSPTPHRHRRPTHQPRQRPTG